MPPKARKHEQQEPFIYERDASLNAPLGLPVDNTQPIMDDGVHFIEFKQFGGHSTSPNTPALHTSRTPTTAAASAPQSAETNDAEAQQSHDELGKEFTRGERNMILGDEEGELDVNAQPYSLAQSMDAEAGANNAHLHGHSPAFHWQRDQQPQQQQQEIGAEGQSEGADVSSSSLDDLRPPEGTPPWAPGHDVRVYTAIKSPMARLHKEIVDLERFVTPTNEEEQARRQAIERVSQIAQSIWPTCTLEPFGSYKTGLYLPTSDVDSVILNSGCDDEPKEGLKALAIALTRSGVGSYIQLITTSKVPIVKFTERTSGVCFDISFEVCGGPAAADLVRDEVKRLPALKPLAIVVKLFLQQRDLNEVYTGGLGSYALLVMLISFLRQHPYDDNLGFLLLRFFELYGRQMNPDRVGISCRNTGGFFDKHEAGFTNERGLFFAIEDPYDPSNDLGQSTFNAKQIRSAFSWAVNMLESPSSDESLLLRILRVDDALALRKPLPAEHEVAQRKRRCLHRNRHRSKRRRRSRSSESSAHSEEAYISERSESRSRSKQHE